MALRLDWDSLIIDWQFDYLANLVKKPFSGAVHLSTPTNMSSVTGSTQLLTLKCDEDFKLITDWFDRGYQYLRCPLFYRAPLVYEGTRSFIDFTNKVLTWERTKTGATSFSPSPYCFDLDWLYFIGANSNAGVLIDPNQPVQWKLKIKPLERGFRYQKRTKTTPSTVQPIPFVVVPVFDKLGVLIDPLV
jgi:hypothetical protein